MKDGLAANRVYAVLQDQQGYIWLATENGLDRYDGYSFKTFAHDPSDPDSLSGNTVKAIYQDPKGNLWIGIWGGGLDEYDSATETFRHYRHIAGNTNSLISDKVWSVSGGPDETLLIGTYDAGLDVLDPKSGQFRHYPASQNDISPSDNRINAIFEDAQGTTWLATESGLDEIDLSGKIPTKRFRRSGSREANIIWSASQDNHKRIWLATQYGPTLYTPGDKKLPDTIPLNEPQSSLRKSNLRCAYVDSNGNAWFGSIDSGLYMVQHNSNAVKDFQLRASDADSLSSDVVWDIYEDRSGYLWVATDAGVNLLDLNSLAIHNFRPLDLDGQRPGSSDKVLAILNHKNTLLVGSTAGIYQIPLNSSGMPDESDARVFTQLGTTKFGWADTLSRTKDGDILAGTENGYLLKIDQYGKILRSWEAWGNHSLRRQITTLLITKDNTILVGTFGGGLVAFDTKTGKGRDLAGSESSELAQNDNIETMLQSPNGAVWVGTFRGLFRVNLRSGISTAVPMLPGGNEPTVQGLYPDAKNNLWIGTLDGLWRLRLDAYGNPVSSPIEVPQFRRTQVLSIESDDQGYLWLATVDSLVRYNPATGDTLTYGAAQGSPIDEYISYGHMRTPAGWLWFGGVQGALGFDPSDLKPNLHSPVATILRATTYRHGKPINGFLHKDKPLQLHYQDAITTFDLAAMDFGAPQANTFTYRLLGFQSDWTSPSIAHQITFTNLNPGRYRLEVKAANNWGTWSIKPATLDIVVLPPWWRTWWAYTLYLLIIIGTSIGYVHSLKRKIEREKEVSASLREANEIKSNFVERLQTQVAAATRELRDTLQGVNLKNAELEIAQKRATEGEQVKSQFLAHMSHELRTPLTGVLGFTKLLSSTSLSSEQKDYVGTIRQSSETLLAIINDTLDLSKLDAGKLLVDEVDFDLLEVIESTLELLAPTAYQKRLELIRVIPPDVPLQLRGDPLRLRQVLTNLLSNAIKFTESGAVAIQVSVVSDDERETALSIAVTDTGIGISETELPKLFHAYARSRISTRQHVEGTGLGLAICKKLLDLMGGMILVKSRVGSGTTFEFQLKFKLQKNAAPRTKLPMKLSILLYDRHPLSSLAWRASLTRLGAEVREVADLESLIALKADAAVLSLSELELAHLGELKQKFSPALPPMLILAPRIERQALKDLSETLYHRVLSKSAREKTVYLELQSLVQTAIQPDGPMEGSKKSPRVSPGIDAPLVIVADDNRINRRLLVTMLNHAGFRTSEAGNGHELLDLAARGPWSAALLDIHMPGMDGIETANRLRASYGDNVAPIIAMSADVMPETRQQLDGVMDDFLVKPFSEQELVDKLRWHLDRHMRRARSTVQGS